MKKIVEIVIELFMTFLAALALLAIFAGAYLQESYKLNPPTEAERAQNPIIIGFLTGFNGEAD